MKWKLKLNPRHLLKIVSVLLAIILWMYVVNSAQVEIEKIVKINYKLPEGMAVSNQVAKTVKYSIKGPRVFIKNIGKREDQLLVNLEEGYEKNKLSYQFDVRNLGLEFPFGVEVTDIEPKFIDVVLDKKIQKQVPVQIQTVGEVTANHELYQQKFEPQIIVISGAKSVVSGVSFIHTLPIDLSQLEGRGEKDLAFEIKDKRIETMLPSGKFFYEVRPKRSNLLVKNIPITFMTTNLVRNVNRRQVDLMVLAKGDATTNIDRNKVRVIADITPGAKGRIVIELKATLPDGYELVDIIPSKIIATIE